MALHPLMPGADGVSGISVNGRPTPDPVALVQQLAAYRDEVPREEEPAITEFDYAPSQEQEPEEDDDGDYSEMSLCINVAKALLALVPPRADIAIVALDGDLSALLGAFIVAVAEQGEPAQV